MCSGIAPVYNPTSLQNIYSKVSTGRDISASDLTNSGSLCEGKAPSQALQDALSTGSATNSAPTTYQQDAFNWVDFGTDLYGVVGGGVRSVGRSAQRAYSSVKQATAWGVAKGGYYAYKAGQGARGVYDTIRGWWF